MTWSAGWIQTGYSAPTLWSLAKKRVRPPVELKIYRCGASLWKIFRQYQYLNGKSDAGVRCYVALYQNKPIAFIAIVCTRMKAKYYRVSRSVVLPDYQGIGIGKRFLDFIAELYSSQTKMPFYTLTSNPQLIHGRLRNWKRFGHSSKGKGNTRGNTRINDEIR